jgi:hypothetical protein
MRAMVLKSADIGSKRFTAPRRTARAVRDFGAACDPENVEHPAWWDVVP